jgi:CobQ-like glutamine amidotransferase family enzyme
MRAVEPEIERALASGAVVFAVCAGFQLIGTRTRPATASISTVSGWST